MTEPKADLVEAYVAIALSGAKPDDLRLAALMDFMQPEEIERARERIGAEWLRREPITRPN